eukprot:m.345280 g.345280  ORF g.345280 m.345280 type:complete len:1053 (-) comp16140_c0_seq2:7529-10687(-)
MSAAGGYSCEYAKSSRASCRGCQSNIGKGSLRVARLVPSPHFDGMQPMWYHVRCFFSKGGFGLSDAADIKGLHDLRLEDQETLKDKVATLGSSGAGGKGAIGAGGECPDLVMEYAKSARAKCRKCEENIAAKELRLGMMMEPETAVSFRGKVPWWFHRKCFFSSLSSQKEIPVDGMEVSWFKGSKSIKKPDRDDVAALIKATQKQLGVAPSAASASGKRKSSKKGETATKAAKKEEEQQMSSAAVAAAQVEVKKSKEQMDFETQNKLIWQHRDSLKKVATGTLKQILYENDQPAEGGHDKLVARVVDGLLFGKLGKCRKCKETNWRIRADGMHCRGNVSEWERCDVVTQSPPRTKWQVTTLNTLKGYEQFKFKKTKQLFSPEAIAAAERKAAAEALAAQQTNVKAETMTMDVDADADDGDGAASGGILAGHQIATVGRLKSSQATLKKLIKELGGSLHQGAINSTVMCVISDEATIEKNGAKIQQAKKFGVPIVDEAFLTECSEEGQCVLMEPHVLLCTSTVIEPSQEKEHLKRLEKKKQAALLGSDSTVVAEQTAKSIEKLLVKGRGVVDPESGLQQTHHVLEEGDTVWNASLMRTDIQRGSNSYYKLQILVSDTNKATALFRSWGRLGTTQGGSIVTSLPKRQAKKEFELKFYEMTGNEYGNLPYTKMPNAYFPLDIQYEDATAEASVESGSRTKLAQPVVKLVQLLFDVDQMKNTMKELEIDMSKLPLGKLSKATLDDAMTVLGELTKVLGNARLSESTRKSKITALSNQFYTYIPHDFGLAVPPPLNNTELINAKVKMIEELTNLEVASRLLKTSAGDADKDPVDVHYEKLHTNISALDRRSDVFKMIQKYVKNTHASTHSGYTLDIEDAFEIEREGETERYMKKSKDIHNKRLLWHGSRLTNFVGILSEGLRIAPPSAPVTGYMFGKGIYLADMVSKSANYCFANSSNTTGLILLCEAALGDMYERTSAEYVTKLPAGKHSTFGMGKTAPTASQTISIDDGEVSVPLGKGKASGVSRSSLYYNEFIVYDVAQVRLRYLLRVNFNFKR